MNDFVLPEETVHATGLVTLANYEVRDDLTDIYLQHAHNITSDEFRARIAQLGHKTREQTFQNKVQNEGLAVLAGRLAGETTYTGALNYGCLGTGSTAVTASDGQLETEVFRKLFAVRERTGQSVTLRYYFSKVDTNGTYEEFGVCIDGTQTANSGQFYNRVLEPVLKVRKPAGPFGLGERGGGASSGSWRG